MTERAPEPTENDVEAKVAAVRAKLASGRSMSGLKDAKILAKRQPGELTAALLADAYEARIDDLTAAGMLPEAREVVAVATERFPELRDRWQERGTRVARRAGDLDDILLAYRDAPDAPARAAASADLTRHLRDPAAIARSGVLAPDDPLRQGAIDVARAFAAAANAALGDADRAALRAIPRRSPLSPWRSLTLALDAFHRRDAEACRRQLERIDDGSAVARGKRVLHAILAGEPVSEGGPATARLLAKLSDGMHEVCADAARLATETGSARERDRLAGELVVRLTSRSPRLAARLLLWMKREPAFHRVWDEFDEGAGPRIFGRGEWLRLVGISFDDDQPFSEALIWISWLLPTKGDIRPTSDVELAAVLARILEPLRRYAAELEEIAGPEAVAAIGNVAEVRAAIDALLDGPDDWLIDRVVGPLLMSWTFLLAALRQRTGVRPAIPDPFDELVLHALALDGLGDTVARHLQWIPARQRNRRDQLLRAWSVALPGDPAPWLLQAADAERRGALRKALGHLDRAEALAPIDERVRSARFRVLMSRLRKHAADQRPHLCEKDLAALDELPAASAPERQAYLRALRVALALAGDDELIASLGAQRTAAIADLARRDLDGARGARQPGLVVAASGSLRDRLGTSAWLQRVREMVGAEPMIGLPPEAARATDADLPSDARDLLALCDLAEPAHAEFLTRVAHRGLQADGLHLPRFLLARGMSLSALGVDRAIRCFELARHFAERTGDFEVARRTHAFRELDDATAARHLAAERASPVVPAPGAGRRKQATPKRRQRRPDPGPRLPFGRGEAAENET